MNNRKISIGIVGLLVIGGFLGLFIATDQVRAVGPTYVSGSISADTTWYQADSPYIVMGDITVEPGFTLTIEPGVEVRFDGTYSIIVDGILIANGNPINTIKFTSNQSSPAKGDWYTIRLRTDYNLINYAEVEYASYGVFMTLFGTHNTISNSTLEQCKFDGIYITNSDNNMISNCTCSLNDRFGITIYESYGTQVDNCTIQDNNYFGINLNASTFTEIYHTNISYNDGKGILLYSDSHNTTILGCEIDWNNNKGIDLWGTSDNDIINTTVIGNNGVGIDFGGVTKRQWIQNCTVTDNNDTGIDLRGSSYSNIVDSRIYRNRGHGGIFSGDPVECININNSEVVDNYEGHGIDLQEAYWVNITYSNISENAGNGILFSKSLVHSNNRIQNCTVAHNDIHGINFVTGHPSLPTQIKNNFLYFNTIYSNEQNGLLMQSAEGTTYIQFNNVFSNNIISNKQTGIKMYSGNPIFYIQYNNIYSNIIDSNYVDGLNMEIRGVNFYIDHNNIYSNVFSQNKNNGVYFHSFTTNLYFRTNKIYSNEMSSNGQNGIYLFSTSNRDYIEYNDISFNTMYKNGRNGICIIANSKAESYLQDNDIYSNIIYDHQHMETSLSDAVDNNDLLWTTYGNTKWVDDTSTYVYDGDSARGGNLTMNQKNYIETFVLGPGTLKFYWRVHTQPIADKLKFFVDDSQHDEITGFVDWHQEVLDIDDGFHNLRWAYEKYDWQIIGSNSGWLDKVEFSGHRIISGIIIHARSPSGTWLESEIYNNTITTYMNGLVLSNLNSHIIYANNISRNNDGILLMRSSSNELRHNNVTFNNCTGINLTASSNNNILENNNITSNNKSGLAINDDSNNNLITRNNITYNLEIGVSVTGASGNRIHHNNFIGNTQNAYDSTIALNEWDDGVEGNYWSDYLGVDDDGDGFGEDPYVIPGGGSRDWHPFIDYVNVTAPYITHTMPVDGEINVPVDTDISIFFSHEMNTTAVESAISISGGLTPTGFVWDPGNKNVTFTPSSILDMATKYTVTISTDAKDTEGNRIKITYVFTFTTLDIIPPLILLTSPINGDTNVDRNEPVAVKFNETMDIATVTFSCFPDPGGWSVSWNDNNTIATYSHNKFGNEATYTFNITAGKDLAGLDLVAGPVPNPWWFSTPDTVGPEITSTSPVHNEDNVSTTANVVVNFNEEMDLGSVTYTCSPDPLNWSVVWTNNNKTATFSHNQFTERTWYSFHVTGAKDIHGNDLNPGAAPNPWYFTTTGDYDPPQITLTSPTDNETAVERDMNITVTFDEAMNTASMNFICLPDPRGWSVTWSGGDTIATFSHNLFKNSTTYTFHINTAKDVQGNDLTPGAVPNPWSFTTVGDLVAPEIISTSPAHNEENVHQDADVVVTFNEVMDPSSLSFTCTSDPGGWSETWSNGDMIVTFKHDLFDVETTYIFQITGAKDISGNDLTSGAVPNPWSFTTAGDIMGPQIILTSPADNEMGVDPTMNITVTFNESIDNSTLTYICFPDPGGWTESWSSGGTVVTFTHDLFKYDTIINFYIISAEDISGNVLRSGPVPNPWSFTTVSVKIDTPYITSTSPANDELNVDLTEDIVVTFSRAMNTSTLDYLCIPDPGGWSQAWSSGDTVLILSHDPFDFGTLYNFYVIAGRDISGVVLGSGVAPNPWSFTTLVDAVAPRITLTAPTDDESDVTLDRRITVVFSEAMDTSSIDYTCTPDPGGWTVSWSKGDTVVNFLHYPFALGTTYTFHITAGKDLSGNDLTSGTVPHSWSFTTISIDSLTVTPSEVSITVNGTVVLIAQAYDAQNNPITGIKYAWSVNNDLGTIFSQNREIATFQASLNTGTCMVNVSAEGKNAIAVITITSEESDVIESEESRPEDMDWISFLWLLIITTCIVIIVVVLWKKGPEEDSKQPEEDATSEETAGNDLVGKEVSETEILPPPPEETVDESPDAAEVPPEGPDTPPEEST